MPHEEDQRKILKSLGLNHAEEALIVLQHLVTQNIVSKSQMKSILSSNENKSTNSKIEDAYHDSKYMTRHIALRFHYDGANYNGLAQNVNSPLDNSVEKVLFQALEKTCLIKSREDCGYSRSGRTDKGVSAFGQVIALRVRSKFLKGTEVVDDGKRRRPMTEDDLPRNAMTSIQCWIPPKVKAKKGSKRKLNDVKAENLLMEDAPLVQCDMSEKDFAQILNNVLPPTIRVLGWSPVSQGFSARFSTVSRTYRYFFVKRDLNLDAMRKGLEYMIGRHDFRNFCKMNVKEVDNFERVILHGKIVVSNTSLGYLGSDDPFNDKTGPDDISTYCDDDSTYRQLCYFEIRGQAFLWHQIRCIVSILFMIGKGDESPDIVKQLLDVQNVEGKPSYSFAPELPLVLHQCEYKNLRCGHNVKNLWKVSCDLEAKWEETILSAERIKNGLLSLRSEAEVHKNDLLDFVQSILQEKEQKRMKLGTTALKKKRNSNMLPVPENNILTWGEAIEYIREHTGLRPDIQGPIVQVHYPLINRARGTTYEEKVSYLENEHQDSADSIRYTPFSVRDYMFYDFYSKCTSLKLSDVFLKSYSGRKFPYFTKELALMVSPNSYNLKVRRSGPLRLPTKLGTAYHHSRNIMLSNSQNLIEQTYVSGQSGVRSRYPFSPSDRHATEDIRDDVPSVRDDGNGNQRHGVFQRYDERHSPSLLHEKPQPSDTLQSPPRVHRKRNTCRELENSKNLGPGITSFPVQARCNRNTVPHKSNLSRIPLSLSDHEIIGEPNLNIYRFRLPNQLLPILDQIVDGCERQAQKLQNGWSTDLYSLTKQDIALRDIPDVYEIARPITSYIYRITALVYGFQSMKVDHNQPHVLKYDDLHTGVELHHDKSDVTMNIMLSRSDSYGGGGTYFPEAKKNVRLEFGEFLLHPGNAVHGGTPITHGSRYLMVIFAHEKK